jgi:hypothetical protein
MVISTFITIIKKSQCTAVWIIHLKLDWQELEKDVKLNPESRVVRQS